MRAVCFDAVDRSLASAFWRPGAFAYQVFGKADVVKAATSVDDVLEFASSFDALHQLELWLHAFPGGFKIGRETFNDRDLKRGVDSRLHVVGDALSEVDGVFWIRGCSAFAGPDGKRFAAQLADVLGCRVAAHTHIIGTGGGFHSGLHSLEPGELPRWSDDEGRTAAGYGQRKSHAFGVRTVHAWRNTIPEGW